MQARYPVIVVGSGPTGLTLANLLGRAGIDTLLVERHATTVQEPRAVSIDDESLRTMQAAGAIETIMRDVVPGYGSHYYSPRGRCFAKVEPTGTPFGYPRRNAFRQPVLEQQLRDNLVQFPLVHTLFGWQLTGFEDGAEAVRAELASPDGTTRTVTCDYLVGCDGASSTVRDRLGIELGGTTFDERWLIVDLENSGNSTKHTKVFCDIRRPCITLPGPQDTRRFEFKLHAGERDADLLDAERIGDLLATHGADPAATIRRKVVYHFHARVADRWSRGRVFLAGDAVHLTPPFAGQGMNSGIRDAQNLAWKLASVVRGVAGPGLLDSYVLERRDHVWAMIRLALRMGRIMSPASRLAGFATRMAFTALRAWPPASTYVLQMKYKPKPRFSSGFLLPPGRTAPQLVGRLFPQPYVVQAEGRRVLLDEVLTEPFCLIAYTSAPDKAFGLPEHPVWNALGIQRVAILPPGSPASACAGITVVAAADGALAAVVGRHPDALLLLRPDRYVAAAFTLMEASQTAIQLEALLARTWPKHRNAPDPYPPVASAMQFDSQSHPVSS
jgi:3-(3-hydroxy-phenyl)propionate hydroxylase